VGVEGQVTQINTSLPQSTQRPQRKLATRLRLVRQAHHRALREKYGKVWKSKKMKEKQEKVGESD